MSYASIMREAEKFRLEMEKCTDQVNEMLSEILEDYNASICYQPGDCWVVLFNDDHNAHLSFYELDEISRMTRDEAFKFLMNRSI